MVEGVEIRSNVVAFVPRSGPSETWVAVQRGSGLTVWQSSYRPMVEGLSGEEYEVMTWETWMDREKALGLAKLKRGVYGK